MASATIDIIFKFQQTGERIFQNLRKDLDKIEIKMKEALRPSVEIPIKEITGQIKEAKEFLIESVEDAAQETEILFASAGQNITKTAEAQTNRFVATVTALLGGAATTGFALFKGAWAGVEGGFNAIKLFLKEGLSGTFQTIVGRLSDMVILGKQFFQLFFSTNSLVLATLDSFKAIKTIFLTVTTSLGGIVSYVFIGNMFFKNAIEFLKKIVGKGEEVLNPVQRISRLVTTIDTSLHSSQKTLGLGIKTVSFGLASIFGPFSGIISGLATANVFTQFLSRRFAAGQAQISAFFGSVRAELFVIITGVKDFFLELTKTNPIKTFIGLKPKSLLQEILGIIKTIIPFVQKVINPANFVKFSTFIRDIDKFIADLFVKVLLNIKNAQNIIQNSVQTTKSKIQNAISFDKTTEVGTKTQVFFDSVRKNIKDIFTIVSSEYKSVISPIFDGIKGITGFAWNGIKSIFSFSKQYISSLMAVRGEGRSVRIEKPQAIKPLEIDYKVLQDKAKQYVAAFYTTFSQEIKQRTTKMELGHLFFEKMLSGESLTRDKLQKISDKIVDLSKSELGKKLSFRDIFQKAYESATQIKPIVKPIPQIKSIIESNIKELQKSTEKVIISLPISARPTFSPQVKSQLEAEIKAKGGSLFSNIGPQLQPSMFKFKKELYGSYNIRSYVSQFFNAVETNLRQEYQSKKIKSFMETLLNKLAQTKGLQYTKINEISRDQANKLFKSFHDSFIEASKVITIKGGGTIGERFTKLITAGFKPTASPEMKQAAEKLFATFQDFFNVASPKVRESGKKIDSQLAQGIELNQGTIAKAANKTADKIAKYFPRSPAELGPLRTLTTSGAKIPLQLAEGIEKGMDSLTTAVDSLAEQVVKHLKPAIELSHLADRVGVPIQQLSMLEYALADLGVTAQDLQLVFQSMQKIVSGGITTEQVAIFEKLGINMQAVAQSARPVVTLFLEASEAISKLPPQSELARKAMEQFGIMTSSNVALAMRKGKEEITGLMQEAANLGLFWTEEFAQQAKTINTLWEQIKKIKDYIFKEFLTAIMPLLKEISSALKDFVAIHSEDIKAATIMVANVISGAYNIIKRLFIMFKTDSDKAWQVFAMLLTQGVNWIGTLVGNLYDYFWDKTSALVSEILKGVWNILKAWLDYVWANIKQSVKRGFYNSVIAPASDMFVENVDYLKGLRLVSPVMDKIANDIRGKAPKMARLIGQEIKNNEVTFFDAVENANKKAKEAFVKIGAAAKDAFNTQQMQKFWLNMEDSTKTALTNIKNEAKKFGETGIIAEVEKLEKTFSKKGWEEIKKGIQESSRAMKDLSTNTETVATATAQLTEEQKRLAEEKRRQDSDKQEYAKWLKFKEIQGMINEANDRAASTLETRYKKEMDALEKRNVEEIRKMEALNASKEEIDQVYLAQANERVRLEHQHTLDLIGSVSSYAQNNAQTVSNMFDTLYELSKNNIKEFFYIAKAAAIAESLMNTAQGVTKALATGGIFGMAQAGLVSAFGAVQVAKITSEALGFQEGGQVPGIGNQDSVPAMLTPGEHVIPKDSVNYYGANLMEALRNKMIPRESIANLSGILPTVPRVPKMAFASGGQVVKQQAKEQSPVQIINVQDQNQLEGFLQSNRGANTMLNFMSNNSYKIKKALSM